MRLKILVLLLLAMGMGCGREKDPQNPLDALTSVHFEIFKPRGESMAWDIGEFRGHLTANGLKSKRDGLVKFYAARPIAFSLLKGDYIFHLQFNSKDGIPIYESCADEDDWLRELNKRQFSAQIKICKVGTSEIAGTIATYSI